jgi:hypothetical protein
MAWEGGGLRPALSQVLTLLAAAAENAPGDGQDAAALLAGWAAQPLPLPAATAGPERSEPAAESAMALGHTGRRSLVEQVVGADGVRRYRLAEPVAWGEGEAGLTGEP